MSKKNSSDIALEIYESVLLTKDKQKRLKSSTFWGLFGVNRRDTKTVKRISHVLDDQGIKIAVKSGTIFGKEHDTDWIILTPILTPPPNGPSEAINSECPPSEWIEMFRNRSFESEREVEAYFICPLLEKLGYCYDDVVIGHPVHMYKGVQKTKAEADFALFNGAERSRENALLIIEAKKNDKGITTDHIGQAKSYAQELLPACYMLTNGQQIIVFQFNGLLIPDERVMDFDIKDLHQKWNDLYNYTSKEATIWRKSWLISKLKSIRNEATFSRDKIST
jgi:hypothetical protein